jgi:hypothetical protein
MEGSGMHRKNGKLRLNIGGYVGGALAFLIAWAFLPPHVSRESRKVIGVVVLGLALFGDYLVERMRARSARRAAASATTTQGTATAAASSSMKSTAAKGAKNRSALPRPTRRKAG